VNRIRIDLNVRTATGTFAGFEDADLLPFVGEHVIAFEEETGVEGPAIVEAVEVVSRLVYLQLDWSRLA